MGLMLVLGGLASDRVGYRRRDATPEDVHAEAARRIRESGFEEWRVREFMTGRPMPAEIRFLCLQITYAAEAIARFEPIPGDFRADVYWPSARV